MIELIQAAALSENANQREAEQTIVGLRQQNPVQFVRQVSEVLINPEIPGHIRQAAGTILAVSFKHKNSNGQFVWDCLEINDKALLKNSILTVLIAQEKIVRRSAANIVASICSIELPKNQWEGIVEKICENIRHENPIVKEASILTLGFICENMKDKTDYRFSPAQQESIMAAIMLGLQQTDEVLIETSLKALLNSIGSFHEILQREEAREYILKEIINIINSGHHTVEGLHILGEFVKSTYQNLGHHFQNLYVSSLGPFIEKNTSTDECVAATQVIENIAEYYRDESDDDNVLVNYITGGIGQNIVTLLLKNLVVIEDEDNIDENQVADSASKTLESIFEGCGSSEYKQLVLNFVQACMAQNNWKLQQGSIKAFSLLLFGLPEEQNQQLISTSFNELIQLLNHNSLHVQNATFDSLVIITEICGEIVLKSQHFVDYLSLITSKMNNEKFINKGCKVIDQLCAAEKKLRIGKFNEIGNHLIQFFLNMCTNTESSLAIGDYSIGTIMSIIQVLDNDIVLLKYLNYSIENFDQIKNVANSEKRQQLYSVFFAIMQYSLYSLRNNESMDMSILTSVYNKTVGYFQVINDVTADGLYAIESLIPYFSEDFRIVEDFWKYIMYSLNKWQDSTLFKAGLSCISFISTTYGSSFGPKLQDFLPNLLQLLQDPNFDRETKIYVIIFIGEIFLNCNEPALPYLDQFMKVLMMCCEAAINLHTSDLHYSQSLKDIIIESLKCVVHGLCDYPQTVTIMQNYTMHIFRFVSITCDKQHNPTVKYLSQSLLLLADFTKFFPTLGGPFKNENFIKENIALLKKFDKKNQHKQTIKYSRMVLG